MSNERNTNDRQHDRQAQQGSDSDRQHERQAQSDESSRDHDSRTDRQHQEKEGKGKVATSRPGGSDPEKKRS